MATEVYSKDSCAQCTQVINLLKSKNIDFVVKKLDVDFTRESLVEAFKELKLPTPRSFPVVFHNGKYVGPLAEVKAAVEKGLL